MSTVEKPAKVLRCSICGLVRVAGKRGWIDQGELFARYQDDPRFKAGYVVYDENQYCNVHGADLHVEEEFPSDDSTGESGGVN